MQRILPTIAAALALALCSPASAQSGRTADQIRHNLQSVKLPPGFKIDLYALVPGARALAVAPRSDTLFVGTREANVYTVAAHSPAGVQGVAFAPAARFKDPNGVCFAPDGTLYVAEQNRILAFPAADQPAADATGKDVVAQGKLIPVADQSFGHGARICRIGPDDKLYVTLGQPYNVPPKSKLAGFAEWGIGGIVRMDRDGAHREVFARGIRNSVGMDFDPRSHDLWFTDNQVDMMGDDIPPGEINHATRAGLDFGFPWYGGGHVRTREYAAETPPADIVFPAAEEVAHAADLGMHFYRGAMFPAKYQGAIFSAQHGSWNRTVPVGARVMVTMVAPDGTASASSPFAEGWLDDRTGQYSGRPVDVAELADGSLLVSDDRAGAIYRISYDGTK